MWTGPHTLQGDWIFLHGGGYYSAVTVSTHGRFGGASGIYLPQEQEYGAASSRMFMATPQLEVSLFSSTTHRLARSVISTTHRLARIVLD